MCIEIGHFIGGAIQENGWIYPDLLGFTRIWVLRGGGNYEG